MASTLCNATERLSGTVEATNGNGIKVSGR